MNVPLPSQETQDALPSCKNTFIFILLSQCNILQVLQQNLYYHFVRFNGHLNIVGKVGDIGPHRYSINLIVQNSVVLGFILNQKPFKNRAIKCKHLCSFIHNSSEWKISIDANLVFHVFEP